MLESIKQMRWHKTQAERNMVLTLKGAKGKS